MSFHDHFKKMSHLPRGLHVLYFLLEVPILLSY
jgi:hypothetical protein